MSSLAKTVSGGGTTTLDFTYDKAGNLRTQELTTTTWLRYTHDARGRLVKVEYTSNNGSTYWPRGAYQYNGLFQRVVKQYDHNITDGTNAHDEQRVIYYSAAWQPLEERVDDSWTSGHTTDRVVQHVWGIRYTDDLVLNRQDTNFNGSYANGGDLYQYALTDHQFSVVALVDQVGNLIERVSYTPYGEARHHWMQDIDGDGDIDATDGSAASSANNKRIYQSGYNVDADFDRNGLVNSSDTTLVGSGYYAGALPAGWISALAVGNDIGYSGYVFNHEVDGTGGMYTVRFRNYDPGNGRWLQRDPSGYADSMNLYEGLMGSPLAYNDPFGLECEGPGKGPISSPIDGGPTQGGGSSGGSSGAPRPGDTKYEYSSITTYIHDDDFQDFEDIDSGIKTRLKGLNDGAKWAAPAAEVLGTAAIAPALIGGSLLTPGPEDLVIGAALLKAAGTARKVAKVLEIPCFVAGTLVATSDGFVPIEHVQPGDLVWAWDEETGETALRPVIRTSCTPGATVLDVTFTTPDGAVEMIGVTPGHRVWVDGQGWVAMGDLRAGTFLRGTGDTCIQIETVSVHQSRTTVYNLEVASFHSYHVGREWTRVHNGVEDCAGKLYQITVKGKSILKAAIMRPGFRGGKLTGWHPAARKGGEVFVDVFHAAADELAGGGAETGWALLDEFGNVLKFGPAPY